MSITDIGPTPANFIGSNPQRSGSGRILSLALASNDQRIYAGSYAGVWRSDDTGRTWQQMSRPQTGSFDADVPGAIYAPHIFDLAVSPADPNIVLAAAVRSQFNPRRNGIYRSADGGESWQLVQPATVTGQILFAPDDPGLVIAALGSGIAISHNAGVHWDFQPLNPAWHVAIGPQEAGGVRRVYAAGENTIWYSTNGGNSWKMDGGAGIVVTSRAATSAFIVSIAGPDAAIPPFAGRTGDVGGPGPHALAIVPGNPQQVYLAAAGGTFGLSYFARHEDGTPIPDGTEANVTADRLAGEGSLWFGDFSAFDATGAAVWEAVPPSPLYSGETTPSGCVFVVAKPTASGHLVFFADESSVFVASGRPTNAIAWHRLDGRDASFDARAGELFDHMLVHPDPHALITTSDFDLTLKAPSGVHSPYDQNTELDQHLGGTILMANDGGVQWSDDGGEHWNAASGLPTLDAINIAGIAGLGPAPALYIGTGDNDSFFTTDGGNTWHDPSVHLGDADGWFADIAQATRVLQFAPRAGGMALYNGNGYPDATGSARLIPPPANSNTSSGHVLRGYSPLVRTLATESAPADGDYVVIGTRSDGALVLFRTLSISTITSPAHWEDPARAQQIGPPLPDGVDIVQVAGGHANPVFYISDGASLWVLDATQQWKLLVSGGSVGQAPGEARRFFADPFNPQLIYVLDRDGFYVSLDGGQNWLSDPNLTKAMTGGYKLDITLNGVVRDMLFVRTDRFMRFVFGSAGVMYTVEGIDWHTLLNSIAMGGCPESGFFDSITDPLNPTLYVELEGRSVLQIEGVPPPPPFEPPPVFDLLEFAAILEA